MKKLLFSDEAELKMLEKHYIPNYQFDGEYINDFHRSLSVNPSVDLGISGWLHPVDALKLYELAYYSEGIIIELGTFEGLSCAIMAKATIDSKRRNKIITIDLCNDFVNKAKINVRNLVKEANVEFRTGDAKDLLEEMKQQNVSFIFVDYAYTYVHVFDAALLCDEVVSEGGYVLFHDFLNKENFDLNNNEVDVTAAVMKTINKSPYFEFIGLFGCSILYKKKGLERFTPKTALTDSFFQYSHIRREWPACLPNGEQWPKITIVTPSYNQGRFLEDMIQSVIQQHYPNIEHIIVDGESNDETRSIIEQYRNHFSHIIIENDRGQSHALNKGFNLASGDILTWLNCDDQLAPGALFSIALAFHYSGADMVAGACRIYNQDGTEQMLHLTACQNGYLPLDDLLDVENCWLAGQFFFQPEVMFTREIWERAGAYINEDLFYSMDYELWVRFAAHGAKLHVISAPIAYFRLHTEQKTATVDTYLPELIHTASELKQRYLPNKVNAEQVSSCEKRKLKIVYFNDFGYQYGAGVAHGRIARACSFAGHEITLLGYNYGSDKPKNGDLLSETIERINSLSPDLVVVGNIHGIPNAINILKEITERFNTVIVMHDKWLFTGGCAYNGGCDRYLFTCEETCPTTEDYPPVLKEFVRDLWEKKRAIVSSSRLLGIFTNSQYLEQWAKDGYRSQNTNDGYKKITSIRCGVDVSTFFPRDKRYCRSVLGLPQDKFLIIIGAVSLNDRRKGFEHLKKAIDLISTRKKINSEDLMVVAIGHEVKEKLMDGMITTGYIKDVRKVALFYAAADIFVGPSLEETFGQVFIEAAACGTPAIGYAVGGISEAICDGVSGVLSKNTSPSSLADAIEEIYLDSNRRTLISQNAPIFVENEYSLISAYRAFILALKQIEMIRKLKISPIIQLPALHYPKFKLDYVIMNPMVNDEFCEAKLIRSCDGFEKWFKMLLKWRNCFSPLVPLLEEELVRSINHKKLVVFGASGAYMKGLKPIFDEFGIKPAFFVDNDQKKEGTQIDGVNIYLPNILSSFDQQDIYIFVASMFYTEIKEQLQLLGFSEYANFIKAL